MADQDAGQDNGMQLVVPPGTPYDPKNRTIAQATSASPSNKTEVAVEEKKDDPTDAKKFEFNRKEMEDEMRDYLPYFLFIFVLNLLIIVSGKVVQAIQVANMLEFDGTTVLVGAFIAGIQSMVGIYIPGKADKKEKRKIVVYLQGAFGFCCIIVGLVFLCNGSQAAADSYFVGNRSFTIFYASSICYVIATCCGIGKHKYVSIAQLIASLIVLLLVCLFPLQYPSHVEWSCEKAMVRNGNGAFEDGKVCIRSSTFTPPLPTTTPLPFATTTEQPEEVTDSTQEMIDQMIRQQMGEMGKKILETVKEMSPNEQVRELKRVFAKMAMGDRVEE